MKQSQYIYKPLAFGAATTVMVIAGGFFILHKDVAHAEYQHECSSNNCKQTPPPFPSIKPFPSPEAMAFPTFKPFPTPKMHPTMPPFPNKDFDPMPSMTPMPTPKPTPTMAPMPTITPQPSTTVTPTPTPKYHDKFQKNVIKKHKTSLDSRFSYKSTVEIDDSDKKEYSKKLRHKKNDRPQFWAYPDIAFRL